MAAVDIQQFYLDFRQEVALASMRDGAEVPTSEAFVGVMIEELSAANVFDDAVVAPYRARGVEVSGYALSDDLEDLVLLVSVFKQSPTLQTTTSGDIDTAVNRVKGFLDKVNRDLRTSVEESTPAFDMITAISEAFSTIRKVRIVVVADGLAILKDRDRLTWYNRPVITDVWDIRRLYQLSSSGKPQEPIDIDFLADFGTALPCLSSTSMDSDCKVHLAILPGSILADIYETFGGRLLERNVRAFLQARGKVNAGIRRTILEEPGRFLAYNNGISATASGVDIVHLPGGGIGISRIRDLQIVNGGQTTASIHFVAKRDRERSRVDLSKLFVQAKLTIVASSQLNDIVPLISRYANSQNKVNDADFEANSPFHVSVENYSRRAWAPAKEGDPRMTHWFYERARGQYADALAREPTTSKKRDFKLTNPMSQKFTKTDLARFMHCWEQLPHIVSQGAEKNFRYFTIEASKKQESPLTQRDFEMIIAKAILYRQTERIVTQRAYGGYRANIVAYTIALMSQKVGNAFDFDAVWSRQSIDADTADFLGNLSELVREVLLAAPGNGNITEWCKKKECWTAVSDIPVKGPRLKVQSSLNVVTRHQDAGQAVLDLLSRRAYPMDRSSISKELKLSSREWNTSVRDLISAGLVSKTGRAMEALYTLVDDDTD